MAACVAGIAVVGRPSYAQAIDFVEADLAERLRSLRLAPANLRRWINAWLAITLAAFFAFWIGGEALVFGILAATLLCAGPWTIIRRLARQRKEKIEDQMADAMVSFASAVRAGLSLPQAMAMLAEDSPRPIRQEFQQISGEYKLGKPLERTLTEAKQRLKSENFVLFSAALLASRESGGRLNETVERISKSILELQRLERKVRSETAQARKSAVYMAVAPVILLVVYSIIDPINTSLLFVTLPGQIILAIAVVLNIVAYFWAVKILNPEI